jgi:programmed cell death protein 4
MLTADQRKIFEKTIKKRELASFGRKPSLGEITDNRWLDWHKGHKHVQVKVSGRGRKGDESAANVLVDDQSPVYALDKGDPNYDSTEDAEKTVFREKTLIQGSEAYDRVKAYKMASEATIEEYFDSNDIAEAGLRLRGLEEPLYEHFFVKKLITMALDRGNREKEAASALLSAFYPSVISGKQMMRGFVDLAASVHDLKLDVPDAIETISTFIARGVVDDILPPKFAEVTLAGDPTCQGPDAQTVASKASEQISQRFSTDRVLHAWGHFDKTPYEQAKTELEMLLKEYLESHDVTEARRRLHDLAKPFFHHELVKKALVMMIESDKDSNAPAILLGILHVLNNSGEVSAVQMTKGFTRVGNLIEDLSLDVPNAKERFEEIKKLAHETETHVSVLIDESDREAF